MRAPVLALAALLLLPGACEREQAGRGLALKEGLRVAEEARRPPPLTDGDITSTQALLTVLRRPHATASAHLGALRQRLAGIYRISAGGETEVELEESLELDLDAMGQYALRHANRSTAPGGETSESGRACWWVDGAYYTARHGGPATRVPIRGYEQDRCLETAVEPLIGLIRILAPHLRVAPAGSTREAGREAVRVSLSRSGQGVEIPPAVPRAWPERTDAGAGGEAPPESPAIWGPRGALVAKHTRPRELDGELSLDAETGAVLAGRIEGRLLLRKLGREAELSFRVVLAAEPFEATVDAPEGARAYAPRPRIFEDRRRLLGETFKETEPIVLPKPGDAPPLKVAPSSEEGPEGEGAAPSPASEELGAEDAPAPAAKPADDEDAPP